MKVKKWNDAAFKMITIPAIVLVFVALAFLISLVRPLESKFRSLMDTKEVYVITPTGQQFRVSALQSQEHTFEIFGKILIKKMMSFDYKGSEGNLNFVRQYTSDRVVSGLIRATSTLRAEAKETTGSYKTDIENYQITRLNGVYIMDAFITHRLVSKASATTKKYLMRLNLTYTSPSQENLAGVYLDSWTMFTEEDDEYVELRERFGLGK